jgi:hypothetical protein
MKRALIVTFIALLASQLSAQQNPKWIVEKPTGPSKSLSFQTNEGTWMNLDLSPDGQIIVFDLLGDIYKMPVTGGKATLLFPPLPAFYIYRR